jgi:hypothetical protein
MTNNKHNKLLWVVGVLSVVLVAIVLGNNYIVNKIADKVIQKLQKDYSPSPYGPGFDPDKIDIEKIQKKQKNKVIILEKNDWNEEWEKSRR